MLRKIQSLIKMGIQRIREIDKERLRSNVKNFAEKFFLFLKGIVQKSKNFEIKRALNFAKTHKILCGGLCVVALFFMCSTDDENGEYAQAYASSSGVKISKRTSASNDNNESDENEKMKRYVRLYHKAKKGDEAAFKELQERLFEEYYETVIAGLYFLSEEQYNPDGMIKCGIMLYTGAFGKRDTKRAMEFFEKGIARSSNPSQARAEVNKIIHRCNSYSGRMMLANVGLPINDEIKNPYDSIEKIEQALINKGCKLD